MGAADAVAMRGGAKLVVTPDGRLNAAAAGRQRDGQGAGGGVPVADDAEHRTACDAEGSGPGEGRRAVLCEPVLRLTLLVPEIIEAILDGRQPAELQLDECYGVSAGVGAGIASRRLAAENTLGACCVFGTGREERNVGLPGYRNGHAW